MGRIFDRSVERILQTEGGYVNIPSDPGGETNFGITKKVAREFGYKGDMKELPRAIAVEIYRKNYWKANKLDDIGMLSEVVAYEIFDAAVNMGSRTAVKFFQRALNVFNKNGDLYDDIKVDGIIGPKTIEAFTAYHGGRRQNLGCEVLRKAILGQKASYYIRIAENNPKLEKFVYGWIANRT